MKKFLAGIILSGIFLALASTKVYAGFGISPAGINNADLKPGTRYVQDMVISRSDPDEDLVAVIQPELGELNNWVSFEPGTRINLPKGEQRVSIKVIIDVPADAAIKPYEGIFRILATPLGQVKGVSVVKGARVDIDLTTTQESVINLNVRAVSIPDGFEEEDLLVNITAKNEGNSDTAPTRVEIKVSDLLEKEIKTITSYDIEKVPAYEQSSVIAVFKDHELMAGEYYGAITVYVGDTKFEDRVVFKIRPLKVYEEVCEGVPEVVSNNKQIIFYSIATVSSLAYIMILIKKLKAKDKKNKTSLIVGALGLIVLIIVSYLIVYRNQFGLLDRECRQEWVNENADITAQPTVAAVNPSSSVQGVNTIQLEGETFNTFGELRVGESTENGQYRVYKEKNLSSSVIYLAKEGENFDVIEEFAEWYRIQLPNGIDGFLPKVSVKEAR